MLLINKKNKQRIIDLYYEGKSNKEISKLTGAKYKRVSYYINKYTISNKKEIEVKEKLIFDLNIMGIENKELLKKFGYKHNRNINYRVKEKILKKMNEEKD